VGCEANKEGTCPLAPPDPTPLGGVMGVFTFERFKMQEIKLQLLVFKNYRN
jgi:hypothetical protein